MKPSNLLIQGAKSGGKTRDEGSITHVSDLDACFFIYYGYFDLVFVIQSTLSLAVLI